VYGRREWRKEGNQKTKPSRNITLSVKNTLTEKKVSHRKHAGGKRGVQGGKGGQPEGTSTWGPRVLKEQKSVRTTLWDGGGKGDVDRTRAHTANLGKETVNDEKKSMAWGPAGVVPQRGKRKRGRGQSVQSRGLILATFSAKGKNWQFTVLFVM